VIPMFDLSRFDFVSFVIMMTTVVLWRLWRS
jgi:hypothetical protein